MVTSSRESFEKITQSVMFQSGEGSEQIQKTLRYNVHKNLGECYVEEESWEQAEDQFFLATQIDRTDVTLWWQLGQSHTQQIFSPQLLIIFCSLGVCEARELSQCAGRAGGGAGLLAQPLALSGEPHRGQLQGDVDTLLVVDNCC